MKLKIDTSDLTFLLVASPVPVRDFDTGQAKREDGVPLFSVRLVVMGTGEAEIINVTRCSEVRTCTVRASKSTSCPPSNATRRTRWTPCSAQRTTATAVAVHLAVNPPQDGGENGSAGAPPLV